MCESMTYPSRRGELRSPPERNRIMNHIIFICTGNTCRSPMAALLCRKKAEERGLTGLTIESMGLAASPGDPARPWPSFRWICPPTGPGRPLPKTC